MVIIGRNRRLQIRSKSHDRRGLAGLAPADAPRHLEAPDAQEPKPADFEVAHDYHPLAASARVAWCGPLAKIALADCAACVDVGASPRAA